MAKRTRIDPLVQRSLLWKVEKESLVDTVGATNREFVEAVQCRIESATKSIPLFMKDWDITGDDYDVGTMIRAMHLLRQASQLVKEAFLIKHIDGEYISSNSEDCDEKIEKD